VTPPVTAVPEAVAPATGGTAASSAAASDPVVAQRGDVKITASQVRDMVRFADAEQRHQLETNPDALLQMVRDRLLKEALLREAETHQWDQREDVKYRVELAREDAIAGNWIATQVSGDPNFPTDEQVQAAYEANKSKLMVPRQYHLAQIFLAVPQGAPKQTEDDDQHRLADLRQQVTKQHADFAALAKRYSDEKASGNNGGDLGWVREDALVPPVRGAVQAMAEGALSDPVRSPNGWHLIKLIGVKPAAPATLAESRDALVRAMRQERLVEGQRNYLANMIKQQPVEVNEIELSKFNTK
jgi:peptidylprolyl isomerase